MIPRLPKGFTHPMPIGKGTFSSVYRVRQSALDRWAAIKILPEKSPERRGELLKEAKRQAQLGLAGIPAIYDAFAWRGQVCIVMQWVKGVTLEHVLERGADPAQRAGLAAAVVGSLAALHRQGFAHRDLKPANILVSPEDGLFLVDFGLAKKVADGTQTLAGTVMGTPAYMAPELWRPDALPDPMRADLYALGRILRRLEPGPAWAPLVESLLREDPAERPATAVAVWTEREGFLASQAEPDWEAVAGAAAAETLARQLLHAAKALLFARREEEAYWLTVECLEVDPDSSEALALMEGFPDITRRKARIRRLWKAAAACGFALAVTGAFLAGRRSGADAPAPAAANPAAAAKALLLLREEGPARPAAPPPLREIAGRGGLSGRLLVVGAERCAALDLDGKPVAASALAAGLALPAGDHVLACREGRGVGAAARRERFTLLPFQSKVIALSARPGGGGT